MTTPLTVLPEPTMLILCGPSGAGKSTIKERLITEFPGKFGFSVSCEYPLRLDSLRTNKNQQPSNSQVSV